jgi:hypothetical protein
MANAIVINKVFFLDFPIEKSAIAARWSGPKACKIPYQKINNRPDSILPL